MSTVSIKYPLVAQVGGLTLRIVLAIEQAGTIVSVHVALAIPVIRA